MTTIATDGKTVAADGLACCGDEPIARNVKKLRLSGTTLYGITGSAPVFDAAIAWHKAGAKPEDVPKLDGWSLLVFETDGAIRFSDKCPYPDAFPYPVAFGSGADFAIAALKLGCSPVKAIELAAECNVFTGGEIMTMEIPRVALQEAAE